MKKLLLLIIPLLLFSCINEYSNSSEIKVKKDVVKTIFFENEKKTGLLPPPNWFKGRWKGRSLFSGLTVTDDNIILNGKNFKEEYKDNIIVEIYETDEKKEYTIYSRIKEKKGIYRRESFTFYNSEDYLDYSEDYIKDKITPVKYGVSFSIFRKVKE